VFGHHIMLRQGSLDKTSVNDTSDSGRRFFPSRLEGKGFDISVPVFFLCLCIAIAFSHVEGAAA
jgi:hypothetical protein